MVGAASAASSSRRAHHPHPRASCAECPVCTSLCSRSPARGSAARNPGSPP
jgi:hypothetical protein